MTNNRLRFPLKSERLAEVEREAKDFAICKGICWLTGDGPTSSYGVRCAPFTLFPSSIPRSCYQEAIDVQMFQNAVMLYVASDHEFLYESLKSVMETDEYIRRLWSVYTTVREEGQSQRIMCGFFRTDYMMTADCDKTQIKHIETNTMSPSSSGLASEITHLHRYTLGLCGLKNYDSKLPKNDASSGLANVLISAWKAYEKESAVILILVDENCWAAFDLKLMELKIHEEFRGIRVIRRSFLDVHAKAKLTKDKRLNIDGHEVAVVYYKMGWSNEHYTSDKEWDSLLTLERSKAIKCPPVQLHLAGCKKIQEVLARPGVLERFIKDKAGAKNLRKTFACLYTLELNEKGDKAVDMAMKNPRDFVLKAQREGGGNNLFDDDLLKELERTKTSAERAAYILMDRIYTFSQKSYLLSPGSKVELAEVFCELGIYGSILGSTHEILENAQCGHLIRTNKVGTVDPYGFLDSPYLTD